MKTMMVLIRTLSFNSLLFASTVNELLIDREVGVAGSASPDIALILRFCDDLTCLVKIAIATRSGVQAILKVRLEVDACLAKLSFHEFDVLDTL